VTLILDIASPQPATGSVSRQSFHEDGGTIGREKTNTWVLPHAKVSGRHAAISYRDGVYYIEDMSRNGVCLNLPTNRLERGRRYALNSGDRIVIDPYEIRVSITRERPAGAIDREVHVDLPDPFGTDDPLAPHPIRSSGLDTPAEDIPGQPLDPFELLGLTPVEQAAPRSAPNAADLERGPVEEWHYQPPPVVSAPSSAAVAQAADSMTIPPGYDPMAPDPAPALAPVSRAASIQTPAPVSVSPPALETPNLASGRSTFPESPGMMPAGASFPPSDRPALEEDPFRSRTFNRDLAPPQNPRPGAQREPVAPTPDQSCVADFAAVMEGAGLDPGDVTPEMARAFGQILRIVVTGVMDVMRSRQQIKDEFRMQITRVKLTENNPLKFSANVDDALHNLLVKRNPAYMSAVEAFEDAFTDLRHHQIAMLAGMRAAFESMLAEFDPDRLQEAFDRQMNKGLVPAKLRYWDLFRERRHDIVTDPEASFKRLFGEAFARAYEDQLRDLKAQARSVSKPSILPKPGA
jgi:type VI secretion system FHA domain protein